MYVGPPRVGMVKEPLMLKSLSCENSTYLSSATYFFSYKRLLSLQVQQLAINYHFFYFYPFLYLINHRHTGVILSYGERCFF
jgi:hypothetical protein